MTSSITGQFLNSSPINNPSLNLPPQQFQSGRGICTLNFPGASQPLVFRTNPNEITWDYELITHIEQTYGGRVIQILGTKMDNLKVTVDCGQGGWPYAMYVVQFMRDLMVTQRNGQPATFTYTTRGWQLQVFALNVPYHDAVEETIRELTLDFKIQQDVSGLQSSASISEALASLAQGIGFFPNQFNSTAVGATAPDNASGGGAATSLQSSLAVTLPTAMTGPPNLGIPGGSSVSNLFGNLFGGL